MKSKKHIYPFSAGIRSAFMLVPDISKLNTLHSEVRTDMDRLVVTKEGYLQNESSDSEKKAFFSRYGDALSNDLTEKDIAVIRLANIGQIFAFLLGLIAIIASTVLALFDKNIMSATILFATIAVLSIVALLTRRKSTTKKTHSFSDKA